VLLSGSIFINRSNNKSAVSSMQQAGDEMKAKKVIHLGFCPAADISFRFSSFLRARAT
jgi:hypothetical protein